MEVATWLIVPLMFFWVTSQLFRRTTRAKVVWPFVVAVVLSILGYLFVRPTCGCIGIDQIGGALMLAIPFNLVVFSLGYIVAFVILKLKSTRVRRTP
jgi:hypothetical protein